MALPCVKAIVLLVTGATRRFQVVPPSVDFMSSRLSSSTKTVEGLVVGSMAIDMGSSPVTG
jgi:hypothetical protein